jgi:hypothetical protein
MNHPNLKTLIKRFYYMFLFFGCAQFIAFLSYPYIAKTYYDPKSALGIYLNQLIAIILYMIIFEGSSRSTDKEDN